MMGAGAAQGCALSLRWGATIAAAYLLGSVSWAYLAGRVARGLDLRRHGSGNLGALNVARAVGWRYAVPTFILDVGKGAAAVALARWLLDGAGPVGGTAAGVDGLSAAVATLAVVAGHNYSIFLRLSGGKGLAAGTGALLATDPLLALMVLCVAAPVLGLSAAVVGISRGIYVAAMITAALLPALAAVRGFGPWAVFVYGAVSAVVLSRHRANLRNLRLALSDPPVKLPYHKP